jgi:hypothetical protein
MSSGVKVISSGVLILSQGVPAGRKWIFLQPIYLASLAAWYISPMLSRS